MGTFFTPGATKADIVEELLAPLRAKDNLVARALVYEGDCWVLWTVEKGQRENETPYQLICCYLLRSEPSGWGYKPLDETVGPCYYSVPRDWLTKYPCILPETLAVAKQGSDEWRAEVIR